LGYAETYNLSSEIIDRTIKLRRNYKIKLPDAIIAATALNNDFVLVTRNEQDFNNIKNTQIFNPFSDYKNSFIFDFELKPKKIKKYQNEVFLLSIYDVKGGLNFNFFNDQTKDNPAELSEFEIETIEFFFIALIKNAANFVRENELQIKDFYDTIYVPPCIYGYQNNEAFFKSFDNREDFKLERRELEKEMNKEIEIIGEKNIPAAQMISQANREVQDYELTKLYEKVYINIGDVILGNRFILRKYPEIYKVLHDLTKYCLLVNLFLDSDKDLAEQRVNRYFKADTVETISDEVIILLAEATKDFLEANYSPSAHAYIFSSYRAEVKEMLEADGYQDIKKINDAGRIQFAFFHS